MNSIAYHLLHFFMKGLIFIHGWYERLFDRWTVSIDEYPYENKMEVTKTNKFNGKKKTIIKHLR